METIIHGLSNMINYIDDLLLHSVMQDEDLEQLDLLLQQLMQHGIKLNLPKYNCISKEVAYRGFCLTKVGILQALTN